VWRLGAIDAPIPQDPNLEQLCIPQTETILTAMRELTAL
jgi:pyruvate/2-oxoglutarate/acetoin dehydrogenase E1 component